MHITSMKVKKSQGAEGDQKNQLLEEALSLGDKCVHMANMTDQHVLIAQAWALMTTIQFKELDELKDEDKERARLEEAKTYLSKFLEQLKAINDEDNGDGEPQEQWYVDAKEL